MTTLYTCRLCGNSTPQSNNINVVVHGINGYNAWWLCMSCKASTHRTLLPVPDLVPAQGPTVIDDALAHVASLRDTYATDLAEYTTRPGRMGVVQRKGSQEVFMTDVRRTHGDLLLVRGDYVLAEL